MAGREKITHILDELEEKTQGNGDVKVDEVVEMLGHRGFGPLIAVPALLAASPLGGIPGLPSIMALIILLFALQIMFHRQHLWLPGLLGERSISDEKLCKAIEKLRGVAKWIDRHFGNRMTWAARDPAPRLVAALIVLLCLAVPFVELLPFAAVLPLGAIALLGLALTVRDGMLLLITVALVVVGAIAGMFFMGG